MTALTISHRWTPENDRTAVSVWNGSTVVASGRLAHETGRLVVVADDGSRFRPLAPVEPGGYRTPVEAVA